MAGNVFGDPVSDDIVRRTYPHENITPELRAKVAIQYINADDRYVNCKDFVHSLKKKNGKGVSALCMIFNGTGDTSTFVGYHDWHGHIYEPPYPVSIQNGQWGCFLHVGSSHESESESAVIYRSKNRAGDASDWMLAWDVPPTGGNHVYTEIREAHHYKTGYWDKIKDLLEKQSTSYNDTWNGCFSFVAIGHGTSPVFVGIMSLKGVCGLSTTTLRAMADDSSTEDQE